MKRLLILGGTGDATKLAACTADILGLETITALAGRTSKPGAVAGTVRVGGFGGEIGLTEYLQAMKIDLTIDATHPLCCPDLLECGASSSGGGDSASDARSP